MFNNNATINGFSFIEGRLILWLFWGKLFTCPSVGQGFVKGEEFRFIICDFYFSYSTSTASQTS